MPALTADLTIEELTIYDNATFDTQGHNLTITEDLNLNGSIQMAEGLLFIGGNLIAGDNGTFSGNNTGIYAQGYIGSINNPLNILATGNTTISAEGMNDLTSVSTRGNSNNLYANTIPGFVFLNDNGVNNQGQAQIRGELIQGSSPMSRPSLMPIMMMMPMAMPMAPISVMTSMPMAIPQVTPGALPVPQVEAVGQVMPSPEIIPQVRIESLPMPKAGAITENILPNKPSFEGVKAIPYLQPLTSFEGIKITPLTKPMPSFKDISVNAALPKPISFEGAFSGIKLPLPATTEFIGIGGTASLEQLPVNAFSGIVANNQIPLPASFKGVLAKDNLSPKANFNGLIPGSLSPGSVNNIFNGVKSTANLQLLSKEELMAGEGLHQANFEGIKPKANLPKPINPTIFNDVRVGAAFKISFPAGGSVMPVYKVGFPLGAEKPLIEPKIENTEKNK
jgi:hypothetical protein